MGHGVEARRIEMYVAVAVHERRGVHVWDNMYGTCTHGMAYGTHAIMVVGWPGELGQPSSLN